jgi:Extracellular link domain
MSAPSSSPPPSIWETRFDPIADFASLFSGLAGPSVSPLPVPPIQPGVTGSSNVAIDSGGILMVICVVLVLLSVVTYVSTGSALATVVVVVILVGFILLLGKLGILDIYFANGSLHVNYHELNAPPAGATGPVGTPQGSSPSPAPSTPDQSASAPKPVAKSEVFHVGGNEYTYQDAPAVCAAYDSELATYDQLSAALSLGAEWCAYGWSQGGMALYPTQQATWTQLQSDPVARTSCGRPGINGGYFDPNTKFGVNCYGPKPTDNTNAKYPLPLPGSDPSAFNQLVNKFKSQLNSMTVNAFNRDAWSGWNLSAHT